MIIPIPLLAEVSPFALMIALYTGAYTVNHDEEVEIRLVKRKRADLRDPKRRPCCPVPVSARIFRSYRALPDAWRVNQFWVLDDGRAEKVLRLIYDNFVGNLDRATTVAFYVLQQVWYHYQAGRGIYNYGYVQSVKQIAAVCGCSEAFATKVIGSLIDAGIIHRKWTGNNLMRRGSCYLMGEENYLDNLLETISEKSNIDEGSQD